jgi:hypothetical protein
MSQELASALMNYEFWLDMPKLSWEIARVLASVKLLM